MTWITALGRQYELVQQRIAHACARAGRASSSVTLVAVTKFATPPQILDAVRLGIVQLGENRVPTFEQHHRELQANAAAEGVDLSAVRWHMIGHLQRNKVKQVLPLAEMVHSVDSLRLAQEISSTAQRLNRTISVLLEVNAAEEPQKYGLAPGELLAAATQIAQLPALRLSGLMTMAPLTDDQDRIRTTFRRTRELFDQIRAAGAAPESFTHLSMGMSNDFEIAIEEGATIVRVGSLLFAEGAGV